MKKVKYLILGAGASGLSLANALIAKGCFLSDIVVLEKEKVAGGLCRSEIIDGAPIDIGGGHFLDIRNDEVLNFLFQFMPKIEWNQFDRISKIRIHGMEIDHPFEANLWQLPTEIQIDYLESIAQAGCVHNEAMPTSFEAWVQWKLGKKISESYMLPYNRKIWSIAPDRLGVYWLHKLPNVSFRETLISCLEKKAYGVLPAHGVFLYPKLFGYGEVWRRMGFALEEQLITNCPLTHIDVQSHIVNNEWQAQYIITTIPWPEWTNVCALPKQIQNSIQELEVASIDIEYNPVTLDNPSHWIYEPAETIPYHRLLLRSNFVNDAKGFWTETNSKRSTSNLKGANRFHNKYAYPVNTFNKTDNIETIINWAQTYNIISAGRWGLWEHLNSDVAVAQALKIAQNIVRGN